MGAKFVPVIATLPIIGLKICIILFSIYTLRDLGELSNLIGSLSRTIQHLFT